MPVQTLHVESFSLNRFPSLCLGRSFVAPATQANCKIVVFHLHRKGIVSVDVYLCLTAGPTKLDMRVWPHIHITQFLFAFSHPAKS